MHAKDVAAPDADPATVVPGLLAAGTGAMDYDLVLELHAALAAPAPLIAQDLTAADAGECTTSWPPALHGLRLESRRRDRLREHAGRPSRPSTTTCSAAPGGRWSCCTVSAATAASRWTWSTTKSAPAIESSPPTCELTGRPVWMSQRRGSRSPSSPRTSSSSWSGSTSTRTQLLVGISLGAAVSIEVLARQQLPIHAALLIRPAWGWQGSPANLAAYPRIARLLLDHEPEEARERFRDCAVFGAIAQTSPAAAEALLGQFDAPRARERAQRLTALPAGAPSRPRPRPTQPVLVLGGDLDPVHPLDLAQQVAADLGGRFALVPPRYDAPGPHRDAVRAAISRFAQETGA